MLDYKLNAPLKICHISFVQLARSLIYFTSQNQGYMAAVDHV